jgi:hypothetical protein
MDIVFIMMLVLQSIGISLGVGSSTLAIINFFVAIKDGTISADERKMMGVVYVVLRVAMGLILYGLIAGGLVAYSTNVIAVWLLLFVLYINALLMTLRIMPSSFGPSIQAGTWYSLGIMFSLTQTTGVTFTVTQFVIWYVTFVVFVTILVNVLMQVFKDMQAKKTT